jgi:hypothetical protein
MSNTISDVSDASHTAVVGHAPSGPQPSPFSHDQPEIPDPAKKQLPWHAGCSVRTRDEFVFPSPKPIDPDGSLPSIQPKLESAPFQGRKYRKIVKLLHKSTAHKSTAHKSKTHKSTAHKSKTHKSKLLDTESMQDRSASIFAAVIIGMLFLANSVAIASCLSSP